MTLPVKAAKWQQSLLLLTDMAGHKTWRDTQEETPVCASCKIHIIYINIQYITVCIMQYNYNM